MSGRVWSPGDQDKLNAALADYAKRLRELDAEFQARAYYPAFGLDYDAAKRVILANLGHKVSSI